MKVKDVMKPVLRVSSTDTIAEAAVQMDKHNTGSVIIEDGGKIVGILTERDILRRIVAKRKDPAEMLVKEAMSSPIKMIDEEETLVHASKIMDENDIRRLVVTKKDKVIGKITANSISRNLKYMVGQRIISDPSHGWNPGRVY